jgi:hypothetical protein
MIPNEIRYNFDTLKRACHQGRLAVLEAKDKQGQPAYVIVALSDSVDKPGDYDMVPFAAMIVGDPYEQFSPPEAPPEPTEHEMFKLEQLLKIEGDDSEQG